MTLMRIIGSMGGLCFRLGGFGEGMVRWRL